MKEYDPQKIELFWQRVWEESRVFCAQQNYTQPKYYVLEMFPYPSGRIHMGHVRNYVIGDAIARYYWMQGYNVLHPIGWDAFGLPAENAAIAQKIHPKTWTDNNINQMRSQLKRLGLSYDWSKEFSTADPSYYKFNQWLFLKMYEQDLVYREESAVNWCVSCQTVLANEQVVQGACWRCSTEVTKRILNQWFLRITKYAEELLSDQCYLEGWGEHVLVMQRNWIGKSCGVEIDFKVQDTDIILKIFTTRVDTLFGATFVAISPQYKQIEKFIKGSPDELDVRQFVSRCIRGEVEPIAGKPTGKFAINPINGEILPIWIANYVLAEYGTGAIMCVPAHDRRDFEFAKKYKLPIRRVITENLSKVLPLVEAYEGEGYLINSQDFSGLDNKTAAQRIAAFLIQKGIATHKINYRLHDWLISRQRYWGTPIPIVYCGWCGTVPVPVQQLPVILPLDCDILTDTGTIKTLAQVPEFVNTTCPECGREAMRETDTMDTFVDSSWYFLRYPNPQCNEIIDREAVDYWLPVDQYIGGIEHAIMHLLYARFITKVLKDLGVIKIVEPFKRLLSQGMVLKDGAKMSKSKGNIVEPDEIIERWGADALRVFILFCVPPDKDMEWNDRGVEGAYRFLCRVYRLLQLYKEYQEKVQEGKSSDYSEKIVAALHRTIKRNIDEYQGRFHFNSAVAALMEFVNTLYSMQPKTTADLCVFNEALENLSKLLHPIAPHLADQIWYELGHETVLLKQPYPKFDKKYLEEETKEIIVQINGKLRSKIIAHKDETEQQLYEKALADNKIKRYTSGKKISKIIYVPLRVINIILK